MKPSIKIDPRVPASLEVRPNTEELSKRVTNDAVTPLSTYTRKIRSEKYTSPATGFSRKHPPLFPSITLSPSNDNYLVCRLGLANQGPAEELLGQAYQQRNRDEDEIS